MLSSGYNRCSFTSTSAPSIASEAGSLLRSFARTFATVEKLTTELQESNFELQETEEAVVRFVPFDFLRSLGKESFREVRSGDHVSADLTVMSFDIQLSDEVGRSFERVNEFVSRAAEAIEARGGFFSQQLGDRMVALFSGDADDALECALEIQRGAAVRVGIASGPVVLGAVGGGDNLSAVAVGPAVSDAHRLRALTERCDASTLVSTATCKRLHDVSRFTLREVEVDGSPGQAFALTATESD